MKKLLKEIFIISPLAFLIFIVLLAPIGIIYTFIKHILLKDYSLDKQLYPIIRSFNLAQDGFANASAGELLNDVLKVPKWSLIKYGKWYQTISAVSGLLSIFVNFRTKLTTTLNKLEKNHCENAIMPEDMFYWKNNTIKNGNN